LWARAGARDQKIGFSMISCGFSGCRPGRCSSSVGADAEEKISDVRKTARNAAKKPVESVLILYSKVHEMVRGLPPRNGGSPEKNRSSEPSRRDGLAPGIHQGAYFRNKVAADGRLRVGRPQARVRLTIHDPD